MAPTRCDICGAPAIYLVNVAGDNPTPTRHYCAEHLPPALAAAPRDSLKQALASCVRQTASSITEDDPRLAGMSAEEKRQYLKMLRDEADKLDKEPGE